MSNRIKPPNHGLTPEAEAAMRIQGLADSLLPDATDSADEDNSGIQLLIENASVSDGTQPGLFFGEPGFNGTQSEAFFGEAEYVAPSEPENAGSVIDAAAAVEVKVEKTKEDEPLNKGFGSRRRKNANEPKAGPPNLDEWMDFFSRIVIRFLTEWYVDMVFRGIDEDIVSDADAEKLLLTQEERDSIARPFAEYANKNPFMRKHGRQIVAFADSFESVVMLGRWYLRVNRIARKYRPKKQDVPARVHVHGSNNGNNGQSATGTTGGRIPDGYGVYNPGGS